MRGEKRFIDAGGKNARRKRNAAIPGGGHAGILPASTSN
jgi:hypothetical protein